MTMTSEELLAYLEDRGIEAVTYEHPPVHTVEESQKLRGDVSGVHTKNLFLRDSKKAFFLVVTNEAATVNLKDLRHKIDEGVVPLIHTVRGVGYSLRLPPDQ